ncbi:dTDP-glucose 4,6-dehydratase [Candidatus Peregrinibacteria bacterium]|nr:dTDP-glucose 4,6-dehydratase [Candidatus Peregrinibacteria bacterium]
MKKILITGGAGFIGSNYAHFVSRVHPEYQIVVLDKLTYAGNLDNIKTLIEEEKIKFIEGDIANSSFVAKLFTQEKFDYVVNFAAETHVDRSILDPGVFVDTNIVGTQNLLLASKDNEVERYHQISTDEVYGDLGDTIGTFFTENTALDPNPPYAAAKASADLLVLSYQRTFGLNATISRCSNNYGPFQFPEKLIPFFFSLASEGKKLPVYGDGLNVRDWIYVEDHCEAVDLILHSEHPGEVFNIGSNNEKTNLEVAEEILKFCGQDENLITFVEDRKAHDRKYAIDPSKMLKTFNWKAKVDFKTGIEKTFTWYKNNQEWVKNIQGKVLIADSDTNRQATSLDN